MDVSSHFDKIYESTEQLYEVDKERAMFICDNIPGDVKTILDVGCGNGLTSKIYSEKFEVTGVEISKVGVDKMNSMGLKCILGSVENLPLEDNSFDMVIASEILEHLDERIYSRGLAEISRVSRNYIIITVPNDEKLKLVRFECPKCKSVCVPWTHLRSFKRSEMESLFEKYNFYTIRSTLFGPLTPDNNSILARILKIHRLFFSKLTPSTTCPICKYVVLGSKPEKSIKYIFKEPKNFLLYTLDYIHCKLSPKSPRWIFALYQKKTDKKK